MFARAPFSRKQLIALVTVFALIIMESAGYARRDREDREDRDQTPLENVQTLLAQIDEAMSNIESELSRIEETQQIEETGETLELNMDEAASAAAQVSEVLDRAATEASLEPREDNNREPREDNNREPRTNFPETVIAVEQSMREFRARAEEIQSRIVNIELAVFEGRILLSVELLKDLSARERAVFLKSLSPEAREIYKKLDPDRFSGFNIKLAQLSLSIQSAVGRGLDVCVPKAEAALYAGCASFCAEPGVGTAACAACWAAGGATAIVVGFLITQRDACTATCGRCRWFRPLACLCHGGCWAGYFALLA
jgi:hypothetical protein